MPEGYDWTPEDAMRLVEMKQTDKPRTEIAAVCSSPSPKSLGPQD